LKKLWETKLKNTIEKQNSDFKETKSKSISILNTKIECKRTSLTDSDQKPATFQEINNDKSNSKSEEIYFHSDLETARIVKKLKAKFDNVDESFIKVVYIN